MKRFYSLVLVLFVAFAVSAQTTIDISAIDEAYTTTIDNELVIDVATASSAVAEPLVWFDNPLKGLTFTEVEISFDVNNYGDIKVLGSLMAIFDATLGRMYFSNGGYLGFNIGDDNWFDGNMIDYGLGTDFIGLNTWKNIKMQYTTTGFAILVDDILAFNETTTDVSVAFGPNYDVATILPFLQNAATFVIGTGSWWSDNINDADGTYWDAQFSYLKNIIFTPDFSGTGTGNELLLG